MSNDDPAWELGPPRDDLRDVERTGTVTWLNLEKRNGRIEADDGERLWFHHTGVAEHAFDVVRIGDRVKFVWEGQVVQRGALSQRT